MLAWKMVVPIQSRTMTIAKYLSFNLSIPYRTIMNTVAENMAINMCLPEPPMAVAKKMKAQRCVEGWVSDASDALRAANESAAIPLTISANATSMHAKGIFARTTLIIGFNPFSVMRRTMMTPSVIIMGIATSIISNTVYTTSWGPGDPWVPFPSSIVSFNAVSIGL